MSNRKQLDLKNGQIETVFEKTISGNVVSVIGVIFYINDDQT